MKAAIKQALDAATIIAMYIDMDGNIYLDDKKIGYLYGLEAKTDESMEPSENGTIIAMYMNMDGYIGLDDKCVGYLCEKRYESGVSTKPPKIPRKQVIQMIKDHFIYVIEHYEILDGG